MLFSNMKLTKRIPWCCDGFTTKPCADGKPVELVLFLVMDRGGASKRPVTGACSGNGVAIKIKKTG